MRLQIVPDRLLLGYALGGIIRVVMEDLNHHAAVGILSDQRADCGRDLIRVSRKCRRRHTQGK